jgi:hypothetical protein
MVIRGRTWDLGLTALVAAQLVASFWLVPSGDRVTLAGGGELGGMCWFRAVFHLDCVFCGMTRSFVALAHGELAAAISFHPAGPLVFGAMIAFAVSAVTAVIRRSRPIVERRRFLIAFESIALACLAIGVFKMMRS